MNTIITLFWITVDAFRRRTPAERTALEYETRRYESDVENYRTALEAITEQDRKIAVEVNAEIMAGQWRDQQLIDDIKREGGAVA